MAKIKNMNQQERVAYMTTEPIPKLIKEMSVPTIISMLVTNIYNMVDTMFVGRIDTQATAAVGVSFSIMALIQAVSFFYGHGSGNYISRELGAKNYDRAERMAATGFFCAMVTGILLSILGVIFVEPISILLGSTDTILPYTVSYLRIIFIGAPFTMGSFVLNNHLRFQGSASVAMIGVVSGAVLNMVLDPIMIFGMGLGVAGAALATILSQMLSFCLLLFLDLTRAAVKVNLKKITLNGYYLKNIVKGGLPSLFRQGIGSVATVVLNTSAKFYGGAAADAAIAAMSIVNRIMMFANAALLGFGQGFQPICGTNYGAGKYRRVKEAFNFCVKVGSLVFACISVLGFVFARPLIAFFRDDLLVIQIGTVALRAQWAAATLTVYVNMATMLLQTIGMTWRASIVTLSRQGFFFIPIVLILPAKIGLTGIQIAQALADVCAFLLTVPICTKVLRDLDAKAAAEAG